MTPVNDQSRNLECAAAAVLRKNWGIAARCYASTLSLDPSLVHIWVQYAHCLKEDGQLALASDAYRHALLLDDTIVDTHIHLGHLLKKLRDYDGAEFHFSKAVRLAPSSTEARDSLNVLLGYSLRDYKRAVCGEHRIFGDPGASELDSLNSGDNFVWFSGIDWNYRKQRSQHLVAQLAARGARIFYISTCFEPLTKTNRFRILDHPQPGVTEVRLQVCGDPFENIHSGLGAAISRDLISAVNSLADICRIARPTLVVQHPGWAPVVTELKSWPLIYDCVDLHVAFPEARSAVASDEAEIIARADQVVVTSQPLHNLFSNQVKPIIIRNAADTFLFSAARRDTPQSCPVVGYVGALTEWFEANWVRYAAENNPSWEFRLVGRPEGEMANYFNGVANIHLLGEMPFERIPDVILEFDAAIIPFKTNELIFSTNPVKLYEYMAAGKPVIATKMPELRQADSLVYEASSAEEFSLQIARALQEDTPNLRDRRQNWANENTWLQRTQKFEAAVIVARNRYYSCQVAKTGTN